MSIAVRDVLQETTPLRFRFDKDKAISLPVSYFDIGGRNVIILDDSPQLDTRQFIEKMKEADALKVEIFAYPNDRETAEFTLKQFSTAFSHIEPFCNQVN